VIDPAARFSSSAATAAVTTILARGAATGTLRADVEPYDVTALLLGVLFAYIDGSPREQTDRPLRPSAAVRTAPT